VLTSVNVLTLYLRCIVCCELVIIAFISEKKRFHFVARF